MIEKIPHLLAAVAALVALAGAAQATRPATWRVDYYHRGGPGGERIEFDRVVTEGPWPGSLTQHLDPLDLGAYRFEVVDRDTRRPIFSRGYASAYGEWETTPEFRKANRYFHESLRFPRPDRPVRVTVSKRSPRGSFDELWAAEFDPRSVPPEPLPPARGARVVPLVEHGPPARKLDLLLISEGYGADELPMFRADAARLVGVLFEHDPFRARRADFNVWLLEVEGRSLGVEFNVFGLERYALTHDNAALRNLAAAAPYDIVAILVNEKRYGGGGIYNDQSTVAASNENAGYIFVHELAHNLAGLGDEYVGTVTYETGAPVAAEPWEPNITALFDRAALKWRDLVEPGTPLPTPLSHAGKVGAFEGARYEARGLYRPEAECIMGTRKVMSFCRVCQRAINSVLDLHTR